MKELLRSLSDVPSVRLNPPASLADIEAVESRLEIRLPEEVREFYQLCDGVHIHECLDIPCLKDAADYFSAFPSPLSRMLFVVVDEHESNPICLFNRGPLRGYVAHIYHDDDSHVRWRSFGAMLETIASLLLRDGHVDVNAGKYQTELDAPDRTERDAEAGRGMLEFAKTLELHSADSPMAYTFAFDLLGDGQTAEIARFLEHEDMFVVREARNRLSQLGGPEAKAVLKQHWKEVKEVVKHCAELLRGAGQQVTVVNELNIRIDPGPTWLDWEALFNQRRRPEFEQWVVGLGRHRDAP